MGSTIQAHSMKVDLKLAVLLHVKPPIEPLGSVTNILYIFWWIADQNMFSYLNKAGV